MTSAGNEEICVQALQAGAASYVPKRALAQRLLETVYQVVEVSTHERTVTRLMECMTMNHCMFELDNDNALIPPMVNYLLEEASSTSEGVAKGEPVSALPDSVATAGR